MYREKYKEACRLFVIVIQAKCSHLAGLLAAMTCGEVSGWGGTGQYQTDLHTYTPLRGSLNHHSVGGFYNDLPIRQAFIWRSYPGQMTLGPEPLCPAAPVRFPAGVGGAVELSLSPKDHQNNHY